MALSARHDAPAPSLRLPSVNAGPVVAMAGLALTLYAMFQAFYLVKLPVALMHQAAGTVEDPVLQGYVRQGVDQAALINAAGGVRVTAWEAFEVVDIAVAALVVCAVAAVVLRGLGHVSAAVTRYAWPFAGAAVALVAFRVFVPPVPPGARDYVSVGTGAWMALAGTGLVWLGLVMAASRR